MKRINLTWVGILLGLAWLVDFLFLPHAEAYRCDPVSILISLGIAAAAQGAQYGLSVAAAKKQKANPVDRGRADDIRFSLPGYGELIAKAWGMVRGAPIWFWHTPIVHTTVTTPGQSGGKGPPRPPTGDSVDHVYTKSFAGAFHDGLITGGVSRIWFDNDLVYFADPTNDFAGLASTRYEAELATLSGGASVADQAECSGGKKVENIGSGGQAQFTVSVSGTGSYVVAVHYTSTTALTFKVGVNGGATTDLVCPASGSVSIVAIQTITLTLNDGSNTIEFKNASADCPDLDYIDIVPALSFTNGVDTRSFSGLIDSNKVAPTDQDQGWASQNEIPIFSDTDGGFTNGGFFTATLAKWGQPTIRIYPGSETQLPDPSIEADMGVGNTPAYRGVAYIVIDGLQLPSGHIPNVTIEFNQGTRELPTIVHDIYSLVGVDNADVDTTNLNAMMLGDDTGFDAGTYGAITWTGLNNATQTSGGAITKTSGANNTWNAYATDGTTLSAGTNASIRFVASADTFMIGFGLDTTPGSSLPNPYDQTPFAVLLNVNSNPSQEAKNAIQMSLGGSNNTSDVGTWAVGDVFQVEIRDGRFAAYQNGILLTGFTVPVPSYPLYPMFIGYSTGGGCSSATFASGSNIGTKPTVPNTGGFLLSSRRAAGELLAELQTRFQFDVPEVDGVVKCVLRNGASEATLLAEELRAHYDGEDMPEYDCLITDLDPLLLPSRVDVNAMDPQYGYHNNTQTDMILYGPQRSQDQVSLSLADSADNIKKLATILLHKGHMESRTFRFTTGPKWMKLHQGSVVTLELENADHIVRISEAKYGLPAGVCEFEAVRQQASIYSPNGTGTTPGVEPPIVPIPGFTRGLLIDAPPIRGTEAGAGSQPALGVAMCGRGSGTWTGGFLFREFPADSDNYELITSTDVPSSIGVTTSQLPSVSDFSDLDRVSSITINFFSATELSSVTEAEIAANPYLNLILIINPDTEEGEFVQFVDASAEVAAAPYVSSYTISTLKRGLFETDSNVGVHTSADEVVVMDSSVKFHLMELTDVNQEINYKFVTSGQSVIDAAVYPFTWIGNNVRPRKVTDIVLIRDGSNHWLIQFQGHPRPIEEPATYIVEIWRDHTRNDPTKLLRSLPVTEGTSHACLLDATGTVTVDPTDDDREIVTSHADKNNIIAIGSTTEWQTIEDVSNTFTRYDWTFRVDDDLLTATGVNSYAGLGHDDTFDTLSRSLAKADAPVYVEWSSPDGANMEEKIYNYGTQVGSTRSFPWDSDGLAIRYTILLSGTEYRVYADYQPNTGQVPLAIIPAQTGGFPFPLRLKGYVIDTATGPIYVDNIVAGGSLFPTTIYSSEQQVEDFGVEQEVLFLRIYQKARYEGIGNPVDV